MRGGQLFQRLWWIAIAAAACVILGAAVSSGHLFPGGLPRATPRPTPSEKLIYESNPAPVFPACNGTANLLVLALLGIAAIVLFSLGLRGYARLRHRHLMRDHAATAEEPPVASQDGDAFRAAMAEQARRGARDLSGGGDARDAVIAAYLSFENAVAGSGVARQTYETPGELLIRVLGTLDVPPTAVAQLRALYENVRFGATESNEAMRAEAAQCLSAIEAALTAPPLREAAVGGLSGDPAE